MNIFYLYAQAMQKSQTRLLELAKMLGFANENSTVSQAIQEMNGNGKMYFESSEEVLEQYVKELDIIKTRLSLIFDEDEILTDRVYTVKVKSADPKMKGGIAYYSKPTGDGRRTGQFFVNSNNLNAMTRDIVATITLHEASPGEYFDIDDFEGLVDFKIMQNSCPQDTICKQQLMRKLQIYLISSQSMSICPVAFPREFF